MRHTTHSPGPTVLISSAGRRVELLRAFRQTSAVPVGRVLATDCSWYAPAFHAADDAFLVPPCTDPAFIPQMLEICTTHRVDLVIPTIDPELAPYATARDQFAAIGTTVAVSSPAVVDIAADKQRTHDWLVAEGFPTVRQATPEIVAAAPEDWPLPMVVKPRFGSASDGVRIVRHLDDLRRACADDRPMIVQSLAKGDEYTIDVLAVDDGPNPSFDLGPTRVAVAVPRRRIAVRAGEVAKAVTVRSPALIELAEKLGAALPGARGPLNIQVFADDPPTRIDIIEINARFGGGFPLTYAAGADMPGALLQAARQQPITAPLTDWRDRYVMLRYDAAVFLDGSVEPQPPTGS